MRDISFYVEDAFVGESKKLVEMKMPEAIKALEEAGFKKNKDFTTDSKGIYVRSEKIAQDIADELAGTEFDVTYDDSDPKKVVVSILQAK